MTYQTAVEWLDRSDDFTWPAVKAHIEELEGKLELAIEALQICKSEYAPRLAIQVLDEIGRRSK